MASRMKSFMQLKMKRTRATIKVTAKEDHSPRKNKVKWYSLMGKKRCVNRQISEKAVFNQ